jgi:hypothetical protein
MLQKDGLSSIRRTICAADLCESSPHDGRIGGSLAMRKWKQGRVPPNLFGPYNRTGFLATLAALGPQRSIDLTDRFGLDTVRLRRKDASGLVSRWAGPSRAIVVALNPAYPLAVPLKRLLRTLAKSYSTPQEPANADVMPKSAASKRGDLDILFGSRVRTITLVAVEVLHGDTSLSKLKRCVPGEYYKSVRTAVEHFVSEGILARNGDHVQFSSTQWMPELRRLLRAYAKLRPLIKDGIKSSALGHASRPSKMEKFDIVGPPASRRILVALAQNGSMRYARLFAEAKSECDKSLGSLTRTGVIVDQRFNRTRTISLNRAHPVYRELRRFLIAIGGGALSPTSRDYAKDCNFEVDLLFGRRLRTSVLLALDASPDGGLDASSLHRIFPEHDLLTLRLCLERFAEPGVLGTRKWKNVLYYDFDPSYEHYAALRGLLASINNKWPQYAAVGVDVVSELEPPARRRLRRKP